MRVMIVDNAASTRDNLSVSLEAAGLEVVAVVPDAQTAWEAAVDYRPDVALINLRLPDTDGDNITRELLAYRLVGQVVMMSVDGGAAARQRASAAGATLFVNKCHDLRTLGCELLQLRRQTPRLPLLALEQRARV